MTLELDEQYHFKPVRVGDGSLMAMFFQFSFDHRQAERFNRVRHFKGVVRVSDIISCDVRTVEPFILDDTSANYLSYTFPYQKPTRGDFTFWKDCIRSMISASFTLPAALGIFISEGYLTRCWVTTADQDELYFCYGECGDDFFDIYARNHSRPDTRYGRQFEYLEQKAGRPTYTHYASIRDVNPSAVGLHSYAPLPTAPPTPTGFWDILHSFPNQGLWKYFHCDGDGTWIRRGLILGSLVIVHDGSYMPEVAKDVYSAAYMIYCTHTQQHAKGTVVDRSPSARN